MIISYCTHSGLRLHQARQHPDPQIGLYLIARIADCDFFIKTSTYIFAERFRIISYCTHSGLRLP